MGAAARGVLLAVLLACGTAAAAPGAASSAAQPPAPMRPRVVVVGAGLAGIAAARALVDAGFGAGDVLLLEGRTRLGGRLHSVQTTSGGRVDLGAMWIHDATPDNPLFNLTRALGIEISRPHNYLSASLFMPDGRPAGAAAYLPVYASFTTQVRGRITALRAAAAVAAASGAPPPPDVSIGAVFGAAAWPPPQRPLANLMAHQEFQTLLNANISQLSALRFGDAKTLPAIDVLLRPGFDAVAARLAVGLPISFNTTVTHISQDASGVTLTTANGSRVAASWVIFTGSLGVLKAGLPAFTPPLPAAKRAAIDAMGMGVLDKLVLVFPRVFWDAGSDFISVATNDLGGRWSSWLNYYKPWRVPVLVALNPADTARALEALSDAEVVAEAMQVLRRAYANASVPEPLEAHVTRWAADPLARGSYSFFAVGNAHNITGVLAEPWGQVLFAGEATSDKPATALGALLSGQREARRLLSLAAAGDAGRAAAVAAPGAAVSG